MNELSQARKRSVDAVQAHRGACGEASCRKPGLARFAATRNRDIGVREWRGDAPERPVPLGAKGLASAAGDNPKLYLN